MFNRHVQKPATLKLNWDLHVYQQTTAFIITTVLKLLFCFIFWQNFRLYQKNLPVKIFILLRGLKISPKKSVRKGIKVDLAYKKNDVFFFPLIYNFK